MKKFKNTESAQLWKMAIKMLHYFWARHINITSPCQNHLIEKLKNGIFLLHTSLQNRKPLPFRTVSNAERRRDRRTMRGWMSSWTKL